MTAELRTVLALTLLLGAAVLPAGGILLASWLYDRWRTRGGREIYTVIMRGPNGLVLDRPFTLGAGDSWEDRGTVVVVRRARRGAA